MAYKRGDALHDFMRDPLNTEGRLTLYPFRVLLDGEWEDVAVIAINRPIAEMTAQAAWDN